jgi:hypothetical protein
MLNQSDHGLEEQSGQLKKQTVDKTNLQTQKI